MIQHLGIQSEDGGNVERIRADAQRLVAARHLVLLMGLGFLVWLGAHVLLGGSITSMGVGMVGLISVLAPVLVWAVSENELNLLKQLERQISQVDQRKRENLALNRMAQAHLAECFANVSEYQPVSEVGQRQTLYKKESLWSPPPKVFSGHTNGGSHHNISEVEAAD